MNAPHHPGELNFYDELGVASNATPEEIREAFRALARMLHPDQQTDPQLKDIAERQMRKLNPIYAILGDPEKRRQYDEDLQEGYAGPIIVRAVPERHKRRAIGRVVWIGAITASAALLLWLASDTGQVTSVHFRDDHVITDAAVPARSSQDAQRDPEDEILALRSTLKSLTLQRDTAVGEVNRLRAMLMLKRGSDARLQPDTFPPSQRAPATASVAAELPPAPAASTPSPALAMPRAEMPAARKLAGFWFYVKPKQGQKNKNRTLYPPEYIEATITEENGILHGKYRSRFQIVDRAISPDVNFVFVGAPGTGSEANLVAARWTGPGGAKGELTLKLTAENTLNVDWTAAELGSQQGLVSGTATLTRRLE